MKSILLFGFLGILAFGIFIFFPSRAVAHDIHAKELNKLLQERKEGKKSFVLIDVRTSEEHKEGYIPGTDMNIPHDQIDKLPQMGVNDKNTTIILYCRSGRRSDIAKSTLLKMGYKNVLNAGGVKDWTKEGYQLVK